MKVASLTEWLFFHLWKRSPITEEPCPSILVPDTIIYRWAQPFFWYFTSADGKLKRKKKDKIEQKDIITIFNLGDMPAGIVGSYMHLLSPEKSTKEVIGVEYLNPESLSHFVFSRKKKGKPILQKFIPPRNKHNSKPFNPLIYLVMIKVTWSP